MTGLPLLPTTAPFAAEQIAVLNGVMAATNAEQRSWLSGFLAGFQAGTVAHSSVPAAAATPKRPLTILYGTESGNSEAVAMRARQAAARLGFAAKLVDMADATPQTIATARNVLIVASTWGEGDPPQRAVDFYTALMGDTAPRFDGVAFGVLALGDSAYAKFCETGRRLDERLVALGGRRIVSLRECDLDYTAPSGGWIEEALQALKEEGPADGDASGAEVIHVDFGGTLPAASLHDRANPFPAEITEAINLNGSRSSKETYHLELSLSGSGLDYEPGDALAIVPENDPTMVDAILRAAGISGDDDLSRALSQSYDVTTLTRPVVRAYAELTGEQRITSLAADESGLAEFLEGRQVIDLLDAFPHRLTPSQLTGVLRPLPPRAYSIASSRKAVPDEAHLIVAPVRYRSHGRERSGVASTFATSRRRIGDSLRVFLQPNRHFRLPADAQAPIIMIGPGTGIAPFRAFMQERDAIEAPGRSWLFFGDRNYTHDFLYQLEWQEFLASGRLTRLDVAFSRDQADKVYVQDRLWEHRRALFSWLEEGAHLYVCGDAKAMAKDVDAMLLRVIAAEGGRDEDDARDYLAGLRRQGRYRQDVY